VTTLQVQARALGDPTRHEVFRYLANAARPVGVAELTDEFGLNHNAIRQHLAKLVDAELVAETTAPSQGRGRPRLLFEVDGRAESRWGVNGPYERLSVWLVEMVRTEDTPVEVGRRAGRRRELGGGAADDPVDPVDVLVSEMARHGFDPAVRQRGDQIDITLRDCPFVTAALADADVVCQLHLGMAYGIAERLDGLEVDKLVPKDPRRAHCRLSCHVASV
jgi:predicted ArsR family transcriptional regulator